MRRDASIPCHEGEEGIGTTGHKGGRCAATRPLRLTFSSSSSSSSPFFHPSLSPSTIFLLRVYSGFIIPARSQDKPASHRPPHHTFAHAKDANRKFSTFSTRRTVFPSPSPVIDARSDTARSGIPFRPNSSRRDTLDTRGSPREKLH